MNKPVVYLQGPDGQEYTLNVTSPDPDDGTYCAHMPEKASGLSEEWWARIVPDVLDLSDLTNRTELHVKQLDNRDSRTTWLWLDSLMYIEVDPVDLMRNMIENCYNEDMEFLFEQFERFLDKVEEETDDIKSERKTYLKPFAQFLLNVK